MCFVIPFISQIKEPLPWYQVLTDFGVEKSATNLTQGKTISSKRLLRKEAILDDRVYNNIIKEFKKQFK